MQDLLQHVVTLAASNPALAIGMAGVALVTLFAWGVISSSYKYR